MGIHQGNKVRAAVAMLAGWVLLATAPAGSIAAEPPIYGPEYDDPAYYDDTTFYDTAFYDPAFDPNEPGCDPEFNPNWAADPYCNPTLDGGSADPAFFGDTPPPTALALDNGPTIAELTARSSAGVSTPLTDLDDDEAPIVGAGRMLLAIDALAELGAFERAATPEGALLLRDIRVGIPAEGFDEEGYFGELERFVSDFIPYLSALESDGVRVSEDLWASADALEDALNLDDEGSSPPLLTVRPWILGLGDLLVRGGVAAVPPTPEADADAIRDLLAAFQAAETGSAADPSLDTESSTDAPAAAPAGQPAAGVENPPAISQGSSELPLLAIAAAVLTALALALSVFLRRKRSANSRTRDFRPSVSSQAPSAALRSNVAPQAGRGAAPPSHALERPAPPAAPSVADLLDASRRMTSSLDATAIAGIALAEARRLVNAEGGIIVRRLDDGLDPISCDPPMLFNYDHISDGCLPRVIETGRSTMAIATEEPMLVEVPMATGAVPIVTDGVITGAILVVRVSANPFDRGELDSLEMLAGLVGSAFAAADTHEEATELNDIEPLTGLHNRRRLDLDLASISADEQVAYVMVDIDHFKNFNDTNGHAAGDNALRSVSSILAATVRQKDLVYRYGGEEFCMLLPGASAEEAAFVAERARAAVEQASIPGMENQPDGRVTISVGVSDSAFGTPGDLVERADAALYEAKRSGRNRVELHEPAELSASQGEAEVGEI